MMRTRHGRACSGHPRLGRPEKTWMRGSSPIGANLRSSLPGLTRQSIDLRKTFLAKKMDARVKPAHDELAKQLKLAPMTPPPLRIPLRPTARSPLRGIAH